MTLAFQDLSNRANARQQCANTAHAAIELMEVNAHLDVCAFVVLSDNNPTRKKMKQLSKMTTTSTAVLFGLAFVAMTMPRASAEDFCRTDPTSGMRGCGFASVEQCQAMSSGRGGTCAPNPFPAQGSSSNAHAEYLVCQSMALDCNAYAYAQQTHSKRLHHAR